MEYCQADLIKKFKISYDSLSKIIEYLDLSYEMKQSKNHKIVPYFNDESVYKIEQFLIEHPDRYTFFKKLGFEKKGISAKSIEKELHITHYLFKKIVKNSKLHYSETEFNYYNIKEKELIIESYNDYKRKKEELKNKPKEKKQYIPKVREKPILDTELQNLYTAKQIYTEFDITNRTFKLVVKYLNLIPIRKYHNIAHKIVDFYTKEQYNIIKQFLDNPNKQVLLRNSTLIELYGSLENFYTMKDNKSRQTKIERYNNENYVNKEQIKESLNNRWKNDGDKILEKIQNTKEKIHGDKYYNNIQKAISTNLKNYGVGCSLLTKESQEKIKISKLNKLNFAKSQKVLSMDELCYVFNKSSNVIYGAIKACNINIIQFEHDLRHYVKSEDLNIIKKYLSEIETNSSHLEKEIVEFIKSIYDGEIIENCRNIISPKELDIYIPNKNLAIEFNGLYWHDENHVEVKYHLNKTIACNEKGIDLIHVFEDDWLEKKDIVKSMIASRLGIYQQKIFARKCEIKEIEKSQAELFFNKNHLQGFAKGTLYLGLFYNNELIQAIIINKKGFHDGNVELTRMVTKINTQVIGGFSKLMKHISNYINYNTITSYIYRAWFNGKGYINSGFKLIKENRPSYYYIVCGKRIHKSFFRKNNIKKMYELGQLEYYNEFETEHEMMIKNKIYRIYDCGTVKVVYEHI